MDNNSKNAPIPTAYRIIYSAVGLGVALFFMSIGLLYSNVEAAMLVSFVASCILVLSIPVLIILMVQGSYSRWLTFAVALIGSGMIIIAAGVLFKGMHWPGTKILLPLGNLLLAIGVYPAVIYALKSLQKR